MDREPARDVLLHRGAFDVIAKPVDPTETVASIQIALWQARLLAGASQEDVGTAIGVSFQAVQKYENGENRLSAGRLAAAAKFLGVPMSFFFQDDTEPQTAGDTAGFSSKEIELVRHYRAIRNDDMREHLLRLTRIISEQNLSAR